MTTKGVRPDPLGYLGDDLAALLERHLYRTLNHISSAPGHNVSVVDRRLISL